MGRPPHLALRLGNAGEFRFGDCAVHDGSSEPELLSTLSVAFGRTGAEFASLCVIVYPLWRPESGIGKIFTSKLLMELGKISYCLYLIHWGILWMIYRFVLHARFGEHLRLDLVVAPVALALSIGIAELSWKYFEEPLIRRSHRQPKDLTIPTIHSRHPQTA